MSSQSVISPLTEPTAQMTQYVRGGQECSNVFQYDHWHILSIYIYQEAMCGEKDENPCSWQLTLDAGQKLLSLAGLPETKMPVV
jgi:hypothetical protein